MSAENKEVILSVENLSVEYSSKDIGTAKAVNGMSFSIKKGTTLGLVGETGAGKTTTAYSIMGIVPKPQGKVVSGKIEFEGRDLRKLPERELRKIRGSKISMIFQDPMTALNPIDTVGRQIEEVLKLHDNLSHEEAIRKAGELLEMVGIPSERYNEYPHQFSGGMKQRVVIAIALACQPEFLIADEPTTALDVTIQSQILSMINELKQTLGTSMLLITHDLGVVAEMCDEVCVVYAGQIVERGNLRHIYKNMAHPYTIGLFNSLPDLRNSSQKLQPIPGMMPDPTDLPKGCKFQPRCQYCTEKCRQEEPELLELEDGHFVRCFCPQKR